MYRLMIYFAHSTMAMYEKDMRSAKVMSPQRLYDWNKDIMQRVFEEGLNIMDYELSNEQMMKACYVYLMARYYPQSVVDSKPYKLKNLNS